jgi:hypothetical protein
MIGVSYGAPTEFKSNAKILEGEIPAWRPERVSNALDQDDLYVDMTFAKVLDDKGLNATVEDFGAMFKDSKYRLWHANLAARRNLRRGVSPALSGHPKYNAHANDIDFQIESDFIGLMAPGLPHSAADIAWRAGRIMNYGDGIYGGIFVAAMYSTAFFEKDPHKVVDAGLAALPAKSPYAALIRDLIEWHRQYPKDWKKVWGMIEDKWDRRDPCPAGAMLPFNIDAKLNGAYIALGLLFGDGDFTRTIDISTRAGQDSDCNPSSAAGILGVMVGYKGIPDEWKGGIAALADKKFRYTDFSFNTIVDSTEKRAHALIAKTGGKVGADTVTVKLQPAKAAKLEMWDDYGSPVERVAQTDKRWTFTGAWSDRKRDRFSSTKGAAAEIEFTGTGAMMVGPYLPNGGKYQVWLDGKLDKTLDAYSDEEQSKGQEALWHVFGLKNASHKVKLVVLGERYGDSKGAEVAVQDLIVYR